MRSRHKVQDSTSHSEEPANSKVVVRVGARRGVETAWHILETTRRQIPLEN